MLQQYTRSELENTNRTKLWDICRERGLKCFPKSADCVEAICSSQSAVEKVSVAEVALLHQATQIQSQRVNLETETLCIASQPKTCADCPNFKPHNDGTDKGWCCLFDHYVRETHAMTGDCINTMQEHPEPVVAPSVQTPVAQSGTLTFKPAPSANPNKTVYEVFCGVESLGIIIKDENGSWCSSSDSGNHATPYEAAAALLKPTTPNPTATTDLGIPEIEVDCDVDPDFGTLYRVWNSYHLLGTFHRAANGKWVAYPYSGDKLRCNTPEEAQLLIVGCAGLLVVDSAHDDVIDDPGAKGNA